MSTAVLDTHVLASGFVRSNPQAAPSQLVDAWRSQAFTLVLSEHIVGELIDTFAEPYFARRIAPHQAAAYVQLLHTHATIASITVQVSGVATHPEDDLVLATAVSAHAAYLVTGDRELQRLHRYEGVTILSPRAFLDIVRQQQEGEPDV